MLGGRCGGTAALKLRVWACRRILKDARVWDESLVLVTGQNREAWKDVEMVKVRVALDEDDAVGRRKLLCQDSSSTHTAVRATKHDYILGVRFRGICRGG